MKTLQSTVDCVEESGTDIYRDNNETLWQPKRGTVRCIDVDYIEEPGVDI